jgi:hypothetical protein
LNHNLEIVIRNLNTTNLFNVDYNIRLAWNYFDLKKNMEYIENTG